MSEAIKLKQVREKHEVNKVIEPKKLSALIKQLQRLREKYGDVDVCFTNEESDITGYCNVTMNLQWTKTRPETFKEAKDRVELEAQRARTEAEVAKLEAKYGNSCDLLETIRRKSMEEALAKAELQS